MKSTHAFLLATVVVGTGMNYGCEADESAPTRPRTQNILTPDEKAKDNAEKREIEPQKRDLPTGAQEFPGQSRATPSEMPGDEADKPVVLADAGSAGAADSSKGTGFQTPIDDYTKYNYGNGPVPPLNTKPGQQPTPGSTAVPGTSWTLDHYWGEIAPLESAPHRAWPDDQTTYVQADVKHNPLYYFSIQPHLPVKQNDGSYKGDAVSGIIEFPWFYVNTAALPVLMILDPPLQQRTTERLSESSVYLGHLPAGGEVVPSPTPGIIQWRYPFLEKEARNPNDPTLNEPATTQTDEIPPTPMEGPAPATQPSQ